MRRLAAALLFVFVVEASGAQGAPIPEAHVLLLDRSALKPESPSPNDRFDTASQSVEKRLMAHHGANLILDVSAAAKGATGIDVTAEAVTALSRALSEWHPPQPAAAPPGKIGSAPQARVLVVDMAYLSSSGSIASGNAHPILEKVLDVISSSRGATLFLTRNVVVVGDPDIDITALVAKSVGVMRNSGTLSLDPGAKTPVIRIAILDLEGMMRKSAAGKDIVTQVHALTMAAESEFGPEGQQIKDEEERLKSQLANMDPSEGRRQVADFEQRQASFGQKVQVRQDQINAAVATAEKQIESIAGPILQRITKDDQANLLVNRSAVIAVKDNLDVTSLAIRTLDTALPHVTLVLPPTPEQP